MTQKIAVPFFRPSIGNAEIESVAECMRSGWLTTGPNVARFEKRFSEMLGEGVQSVAVNSATAALHLGLEAMGIGPDCEVIVPTLTFTATAEVVRYLGATPVFVDMDPETLCLNLQDTEAAITHKTKAIMPVHFAGRPANMTKLREIADRHGIFILDDAAHALPASHKGRLIGDSLADATAFSFYANKTMTTGEGGMLVTRNADIADRARIMRLHGIDRDVFNRFTDTKAGWIYDVVAPGYKYNLTDVAAAMGLVQLDRLKEFLEKRTLLAAAYDNDLADLPLMLPPHAAPGDIHSWHLYIIQLADKAPVDRDGLILRLKEAGIGCSVHYRPLHQLSVWKPYCKGKTFPAADNYFTRCVSIPLFMDMKDQERKRVVDVLHSILSERP